MPWNFILGALGDNEVKLFTPTVVLLFSLPYNNEIMLHMSIANFFNFACAQALWVVIAIVRLKDILTGPEVFNQLVEHGYWSWSLLIEIGLQLKPQPLEMSPNAFLI